METRRSTEPGGFQDRVFSSTGYQSEGDGLLSCRVGPPNRIHGDAGVESKDSKHVRVVVGSARSGLGHVYHVLS